MKQDTDRMLFVRGFVAACAITLTNHDCSTIIEDTYKCNFLTVAQLRKLGVDEYDIKILKPVIKEITRKKKLANSK